MKVKQNKKEWEEQYQSGFWDYLSTHQEYARYSLVAAYIHRSQKPVSLLDLGCGGGILLRHLNRELLCNYTGVDLAESALERIQPKIEGGQFICAPLEEYQPEGLWDIILFNEVLYFLHDPVSVLARFEKHLAPGGVMVLSMHRKRNPVCWNNRCLRKVLRHIKDTRHQLVEHVKLDNGACWDIVVYVPRECVQPQEVVHCPPTGQV